MLLITHGDCLLHEMQPRHPEQPDRLRAMLAMLDSSGLAGDLRQAEAMPASEDALKAVHDPEYLRTLSESVPESGLLPVDPDTSMGPSSLRAATLAAAPLPTAFARCSKEITAPRSAPFVRRVITPSTMRPWASASTTASPWAQSPL